MQNPQFLCIFVCLKRLKMRIRVFLTLTILSTFILRTFGLDFQGPDVRVVTITPASTTGLEEVYVVNSASGAVVSYPSASARWSRFSNLGGGYAESVAASVSGNTSSITLGSEDMGYIVEDDGRQHCFWIVNYANHYLNLQSLTAAAEQECGRITFDLNGDASEIPYYTATGRRMTLSRELKLSWNTLEYDEENFSYNPVAAEETLDHAAHTFSAPAPLQSTEYILAGDRFLRAWGMEESVTSPMIPAMAVEAQTRATQSVRENDNEQKNDVSGLGGSAPCEIAFEAIVSDAAIYHRWELARDPEFGILENSYSELDFDYTFTENGNYYVRLVANNAEGTCEFTGTTYEITIGESKLLIPNAFSPQSSPGVNDEWKVSYKSLIEYECHIFNRLGTCIFTSKDPAKGWDGKYRGKFVPAGVYYYVIKARGADGVDYKRAGDINIINYSGPTGTTPEGDSSTEE